jgi:K+-transporting ATPase A subunit
MSLANLSQYGFFLLTVAALVKPVGGFLQRVFEGEKTFLEKTRVT